MQKRTELFDRMDRLSLKLKVCRCLPEGKTNEYLKAVLRKLEQSGNIWHVHDEILKNILSAVIRFDWFFPESSGTDRYRLQADYQWSDDRRGMQ